ncbi:MAG: DUF1847 domain-containing protein [Promethearchaeota archaeon]|nr:MAG: DUF1847 domain-containing protein [Candidatus Lokiarchaeota archaeon]
MSSNKKPTCHLCNSFQFCTIGKANENINNCPMVHKKKIEEEALQLYSSNEKIKEATKVASIIEAEGYIAWPRLKDTIEYASRMNYTKIGIAFCVGLLDEAKKIAKILEKAQFKVYSVCCKTGSLKKTELGIPKEYTMRSKTGFTIGWISCNPVAQALLLNDCETDLNLIVGLCVGHDITFTQLSKAPVSTLIAKDRSSPHNPALILYSRYGDNVTSSADFLGNKKE